MQTYLVRSLALCWLSLGLLGSAAPARGQLCDQSPWITVWPNENASRIQPRQVFLLSGSSWLRKEMEQFGQATQVYLWAPHDSVPLLVLDRQTISDGRLQLLLLPRQPLQADSLYELRAVRNQENLFSLFRNSRPVPGKRRATAYRWRVAHTPDTQAPVWTATPALVGKVYEDNSEGTDNYVVFSCPLRDSSACLVKTTVRHLPDGELASAYTLPTRQNQLVCGWFTCSGDVSFRSEEAYTIHFEAIDAAGNRAGASGAPLPFQAPKKVACCWGPYGVPRPRKPKK
ncbi:MAG: hypothetical protein NVS3B25_32150 [Hymenobacter sp.]